MGQQRRKCHISAEAPRFLFLIFSRVCTALARKFASLVYLFDPHNRHSKKGHSFGPLCFSLLFFWLWSSSMLYRSLYSSSKIGLPTSGGLLLPIHCFLFLNPQPPLSLPMNEWEEMKENIKDPQGNDCGPFYYFLYLSFYPLIPVFLCR